MTGSSFHCTFDSTLLSAGVLVFKYKDEPKREPELPLIVSRKNMALEANDAMATPPPFFSRFFLPRFFNL